MPVPLAAAAAAAAATTAATDAVAADSAAPVHAMEPAEDEQLGRVLTGLPAPNAACVEPCCVALVVQERGEEQVYCLLCRERVETVAWHQHLHSTVHMFNMRHPTTLPHVWLPASNKGYQLLSRLGWRQQHGLGVAEQGRLEPVPTLLKQDRKGVGLPQGRARITHFPAHSAAEAARDGDGKSRAQRAQTNGHPGGGGRGSAAERERRREAKLARRAEQREAAQRRQQRDRLLALQVVSDLPDELLALQAGNVPNKRRRGRR